ncbi:MAG: glycosyltransferase family 2 protein [Actinomycetota bacterium]
MKLSILIPVFNEHATIAQILAKVRSVDIGEIAREIVVVDDGSTDGTREILAAEEAEHHTTVLYHDVNRGKGAAIRTGLERVTGDYVIIQDADLEYDPDDYRVLLAPVLKKKAEVVYGSRFTGERRNMLFWHMLGNKLLSLVTNILYNTTLSDMETCYKLFSREALQGITIRADRFDFEPEITAKILKKGIRIWEVPISYAGREFDEGKKITWKDGFAALWTLIKYRFAD